MGRLGKLRFHKHIRDVWSTVGCNIFRQTLAVQAEIGIFSLTITCRERWRLAANSETKVWNPPAGRQRTRASPWFKGSKRDNSSFLRILNRPLP